MSELQKLRELLAKAVPTPWELCHAAPNEYWHSGSTIGAANPRDARRIADVVTMGARGDDIHPIHRSNAALIVAAVNALPELLDRLEAAESALQQQGEAVATVCLVGERYAHGNMVEVQLQLAGEDSPTPKIGDRYFTHPPKPVVSDAMAETALGVVLGEGIIDTDTDSARRVIKAALTVALGVKS